MSNTSENNNITCANCGKGEEDNINLKACTACKMVKYCNRECQIAHRPQHKKECKKRAKEIHDEKLFNQPPPMEDCPICMIQLPKLESGKVYMACCGKVLCCGCVYAFQSRAASAGRLKEDNICPFCRVPAPSSNEEFIKRYEKRMDLNDPIAIHCLGSFYSLGSDGLPQDHAKALELWYRAAELGNAEAYCLIGNAYKFGDGVEIDTKKAVHYWELAAIHGDVTSRVNLGVADGQAGNFDRALKHFMMAIESGYASSLEKVRDLYSWGYLAKEDYAKAQQAYQAYVDEIKSDQRDVAAAEREHKYYG